MADFTLNGNKLRVAEIINRTKPNQEFNNNSFINF